MNLFLEVDYNYETPYLCKIYDNLNLKEDYDVVIVKWPNEIKHELKKQTIIFIISDESHSIPEKFIDNENIKFIFKHYHSKDFNHKKTRPLPLGYLNGFNGNNNIKIKDRVIDYGFSGAWNSIRNNLINAFDNLKDDGRKKYFQLNKNWATGYSIEQYSYILSNSKISLCPTGYDSNESFRLIESAMCGNIILADKRYNFWYNENLPYFEIKDWSDLSVINEILSMPEKKLQAMSDETYEWYLNKVSPEAVARYISGEVNA
jgi:hypothetical protein